MPVYIPLPTKISLGEWTHTEFNAHIKDNMAVSAAGLAAAKGNLFPATGANAAAVQGVGSDGQITETDDTQSTGMKNSWAYVPIGGIILWAGTLGSLPSNWKLCDGTNGTPDLRTKFVVGAGGSYAVGDTGGANTRNLQHSHTFPTDAQGAHTHTQGATGAGSSHTHTGTSSANSAYSDIKSGATYLFSVHPQYHDFTTASESVHTHTNPATNSDGAHSHTVSSAAQLSSSQDMRPPFYQLAYIMRIN